MVAFRHAWIPLQVSSIAQLLLVVDLILSGARNHWFDLAEGPEHDQVGLIDTLYLLPSRHVVQSDLAWVFSRLHLRLR